MTTEFGAELSLRTYLMILGRRKWWDFGLVLLGSAGRLGDPR